MSIKFQGVSKIFHRHTGQKLIRNHVGDWFRRDPERDFYALKNVSFRISEGDRKLFQALVAAAQGKTKGPK